MINTLVSFLHLDNYSIISLYSFYIILFHIKTILHYVDYVIYKFQSPLTLKKFSNLPHLSSPCRWQLWFDHLQNKMETEWNSPTQQTKLLWAKTIPFPYFEGFEHGSGMGVVWEWRSHYWGSLEFSLDHTNNKDLNLTPSLKKNS